MCVGFDGVKNFIQWGDRPSASKKWADSWGHYFAKSVFALDHVTAMFSSCIISGLLLFNLAKETYFLAV